MTLPWTPPLRPLLLAPMQGLTNRALRAVFEAYRATMAESERREADYQRMSRQVTEAKLSALQAQVEPHFLYNTLASVQALTEVDPRRANEMTGHLIQYLRNALTRDPRARAAAQAYEQPVPPA